MNTDDELFAYMERIGNITPRAVKVARAALDADYEALGKSEAPALGMEEEMARAERDAEYALACTALDLLAQAFVKYRREINGNGIADDLDVGWDDETDYIGIAAQVVERYGPYDFQVTCDDGNVVDDDFDFGIWDEPLDDEEKEIAQLWDEARFQMMIAADLHTLEGDE